MKPASLKVMLLSVFLLSTMALTTRAAPFLFNVKRKGVSANSNSKTETSLATGFCGLFGGTSGPSVTTVSPDLSNEDPTIQELRAACERFYQSGRRVSAACYCDLVAKGPAAEKRG